jgi:hypothetical protein
MSGESYGSGWKHATIHLWPGSMEMHSEGDHDVRLLIQAKLDALKKAMIALDKIRDPRKRHSEPDKYTELGCVMNIADEAYREITGEKAT